MTINELFRELELAIHDGHGESIVYFDTEARTWDYHLAKISMANILENWSPDAQSSTVLVLSD